MIALSARRKSGSASRVRNAGNARRKISRSSSRHTRHRLTGGHHQQRTPPRAWHRNPPVGTKTVKNRTSRALYRQTNSLVQKSRRTRKLSPKSLAPMPVSNHRCRSEGHFRKLPASHPQLPCTPCRVSSTDHVDLSPGFTAACGQAGWRCLPFRRNVAPVDLPPPSVQRPDRWCRWSPIPCGAAVAAREDFTL